MRKTLKNYFTPLLLLGIVIVSLFWIQNLPVRNAKKILTNLLNIPSQPLVEAYQLKKLDILKTNQKDTFLYEAQIFIHTSTGKEQEFQITGKIQFSNNGKVSSVSLRGRELQRFIENELNET